MIDKQQQQITFSDLLEKIGALTIQLDIANEQIRQLREEAADLRKRIDDTASGS